MADELKIIPISHVFENINYMVPIYQRNYAWTETQIEQLIEDIDSSDKNYFLGTLIVNQTNNNVYEVIDGQQRLITLYLLEKYLGIVFSKEALRLEAREKSNRTLSYISDRNNSELIDELSSSEILNGFEIIHNYFENKKINKIKFAEKLEQVFLIRVQVPQNIDLNHYFEIMNTRGEQLEIHQIAKAKLLKVLESDHDKYIAALIWETCSDMNSYVQMNFKKVEERNSIFTKNWSSLGESIKDFDSLKKVISIENESTDKKSLIKILRGKEIQNGSNTQFEDENENERFESIITFPNFLLQVYAVMEKQEEANLDNKKILENLSKAWSESKKAKDFLFHILKCRVLFDKYVLKREFARDYKETGKWSLQRLGIYSDKKNSNKPKYVATFGDESNDNKKLRTLQSCLRITYTSPKTMHWISLILSNLLENEETDIIQLLENYCKKKVVDSYYQNKKGFEFERIVFSYLDYLIYRDGYSYDGKEIISPFQDDWQFLFRSSIEHFQPQSPTEEQGEDWNQDDLNGFGNLALITVSGNSKFSNLPPGGKIDSYPSIINQSLKLKIMEMMTRLGDGKWTTDKANIHKDEMFNILNKE